MATVPIFEKDPDAHKRYSVDWTDWLGTDNISGSEWLVPEGLTEVADSHTEKVATVMLSGGTEGTTYRVTNRITTDTTPPEIDDRTIKIKIKEQ